MKPTASPSPAPRHATHQGLSVRDHAELLDHLPCAVLVVDRSMKVIARNRHADRLLGTGAGADQLLRRAMLHADQDWLPRLTHAVQENAPVRFDSLTLTDPAGDPAASRTVNLSIEPLESQDRTAFIFEDITREARLRSRVAVAESLAAVGRLAARVAHELNNPLDGSLRYLNLLDRINDAGGDSDKARHYLAEARQGLKRMAAIVSELLDFARSNHAYRERGNINDTIEDAIRAHAELADQRGVIVAASFRSEGMPAIEDGRLYQVCCNIIRNAIDAMPTGGTLTIAAGVVDQNVVLRFEDAGIGLPADAERIFEPFFTTKPPGQGTGLGLAICRDYVEQLGGRLTAENARQKGAIFTVTIPVDRCAASRQPAP